MYAIRSYYVRLETPDKVEPFILVIKGERLPPAQHVGELQTKTTEAQGDAPAQWG